MGDFWKCLDEWKPLGQPVLGLTTELNTAQGACFNEHGPGGHATVV